MKLSTRFTLLIVTLAAAVALIGLAGFVSIDKLDTALQGVVHGDVQRVLVITNVRRLFRSMVVLERNFMLEKDVAQGQAIERSIASNRDELRKTMGAYERLMPASDRPSSESLRAEYATWVTVDDQVRSLVRAGKHEEAYVAAAVHKSSHWESIIADLVSANEHRLEQQVAAASTLHLVARWMLSLACAASVGVAVLFGSIIFLGIRRAMLDVVELNATLEQRVQDRTLALENRERAMQLVLDSMGEGLLSADLEGRLLAERSKAVTAWFGEPSSAETKVADFLFPDDPRGRTAFTMAFGQLVEDILPFELNEAQMPRRIVRDDRHFDIAYRQVFEAGTFRKILLVVSDVTEKVASERAGREAKEHEAVIAGLLRDKSGFRRGIQECEQLLVDIVSETDLTTLKRKVHTLKGNASICGFASVAELCHKIEDRMAEAGGAFAASDGAELTTLWRSRLRGVEEYLSGDAAEMLEVHEAQHSALLSALRERRDYGEIISFVTSWTWGRTSEYLTRLRAQAERVASRLDKPIQVTVEHGALRVPPAYLDGFWPSLMHVVRNAVDHGIEATEAREAAGKDRIGHLRLITRIEEGTRFVIRVADDGGGIDFDAVVAAVRRRGLEVPADVTEALFMDGVSTREDVTDISGRGVGMGAVRAACIEAGGTLRVRSARGEGTDFEFSFPWTAVATIRVALPPRKGQVSRRLPRVRVSEPPQ